MADAFPDRAAIADNQLRLTRALLGAVIPANVFYTAKFAGVGFSSEVNNLTDFSARCPFTAKSEIVADQKTHPPYGTNLTFPVERYSRCHQTSGSTGAPLRWLDTAETWQSMRRSWGRVLSAAKVTPADRVFCAFSFGPFLGFWLAFEAAGELGCLTIPGGGLSSLVRLRAILENQITVLCCTPSYAAHLAEVAAKEGVDLDNSRVRLIIVAGEAGGSIPATRARLEQLWPGARVFDHHGMTETGPVTYECPAQPGVLHVMEDAFLPEVIDSATGKPAKPGDIGELVLTTLLRNGSPLIRYRTGDLVKPRATSDACACGTHELALEGGILSRADDMVIVRGVNVYPSAVEEIIRSIGGIAEYQVQVETSTAMTELRVRIEPSPDEPSPGSLGSRLEKLLHFSLALRIPVETVAPGTLPRFEMKAQRWVKSS